MLFTIIGNMKKILIVLCLLCILCTGQAFATLGVGVGVGKIRVDQKLNPGQIYNLPSITVLNTGTESSDYEVTIDHLQNQPQLIPERNWFIFSPQTFHLSPKGVQKVNVTLTLPIKTPPGDYFIYLEAQPIRKTVNGTTAIHIAAATKLYFTVEPASFIAGIYYKLLSIWVVFTPLPQIIVGILLVSLFILLAKRFINVEIKLSKNRIPRWVIILSVVIFFIVYFFVWFKIFQLIKH